MKQKLVCLTKLVREEMDKVLRQEPADSQIIEAAAYSTLDKFSCLYRSKLVFAGCEMVGLNQEEVLNSAAGIEFIHASSLIFDDLPCMDNSDYRRGRASTHKVYGGNTAILAAIYLLNKGQHLIIADALKFKKSQIVNPELELTLELGGLLGGQEKDLLSKSNSKDEFVQAYFQKNKLMYLALTLPDLLKTENYLDELRQIGYNLCVAYQLHDDLRDFKSREVTGKNEKARSKKLSNILSQSSLEELKEQYLDSALTSSKKLPNSDFLNELINLMFYQRP